MKKAIVLFCISMSLFAGHAFAQMQEVRGIGTRRVIYEGEKPYTGPGYSDESYEYYGWEITNYNSFAVNVDIMLYSGGSVLSNGYNVIKTDSEIVKQQSIILKPNESYIFKREEHCCTQVKPYRKCDYSIASYYIDYKAYKIQ